MTCKQPLIGDYFRLSSSNRPQRSGFDETGLGVGDAIRDLVRAMQCIVLQQAGYICGLP